MDIAEIKKWYELIQLAPDSIKPILEYFLWSLVLCILAFSILKILLSKDFIRLYLFVSGSTRKILGVSKAVAVGMAANIQLPEPPKFISNIFSFIVMISGYISFIIFISFSLFIWFAPLLNPHIDFLHRNLALLISLVFMFFSFFFLSEADKERKKLFK